MLVIFVFLIFMFNLWVKSILKEDSKPKNKTTAIKKTVDDPFKEKQQRTFLKRRSTESSQLDNSETNENKITQKDDIYKLDSEEKSNDIILEKVRARSEPFLIN